VREDHHEDSGREEQGSYPLPEWLTVGAPVAILTRPVAQAPATSMTMATVTRITKRDIYTTHYGRYFRRTLAYDDLYLVAPDDPEVDETCARMARDDLGAGVAAWLERWRANPAPEYLLHAREVLDRAIASGVRGGPPTSGSPNLADAAPNQLAAIAAATGPLDAEEVVTLERAARAAASGAHAPYSGFRVGAAVLCTDGSIIGGCNVENASFGLSMCAERIALFAAVAAGHSARVGLRAIGLSFLGASPSTPQSGRMPCGACRQCLHELLGPDGLVVVEHVGTFTVADLMPDAFTFAPDAPRHPK
jgi:cytidine deaminase